MPAAIFEEEEEENKSKASQLIEYLTLLLFPLSSISCIAYKEDGGKGA